MLLNLYLKRSSLVAQWFKEVKYKNYIMYLLQSKNYILLSTPKEKFKFQTQILILTLMTLETNQLNKLNLQISNNLNNKKILFQILILILINHNLILILINLNNLNLNKLLIMIHYQIQMISNLMMIFKLNNNLINNHNNYKNLINQISNNNSNN